jgi:hypothetical protein
MSYWTMKLLGGKFGGGGSSGDNTAESAGKKSTDDSMNNSIMDAQATGTDYDARIHKTKGFGGVQEDDTKEGWGWRNA